MSLSILFCIFFICYTLGCPEPENSFCSVEFKQGNTFYISVDGSDDKDCSDTEPCGSLQGPFGRGLQGRSNVTINMLPGVYKGVQQSLFFDRNNKTNLTIQCNSTSGTDPCVLDFQSASRFLAINVSSDDSVLVKLIGLQLKNGLSGGSVFGGLILTHNVSCISIENCSFVGDAESGGVSVGRALALYSTRGNIKHSTFIFSDNGRSSIIHWERLYPRFEKQNVVSLLNVTFLDRSHGLDNTSGMIDIYLSNLNNDTAVTSLYQQNRRIDIIYVCIYVLSPRQINSIYINNSEVAITDTFSMETPIHMEHVLMEDAFSVLKINTQSDIEIDQLDWYGGYFSLTNTLTITGTSSWTCQMNSVCTPAWTPILDVIAINITENASLTMTGYFVPQLQSLISIENHGLFQINSTELIKFDKIINHGLLNVDGDLPFLRHFEQNATGIVHISYTKIATWYVGYAHLDGKFWITFESGVCQPHNTTFRAIRYYSSEGSLEPDMRDGLNYTVKRLNDDKSWQVYLYDIECHHLSCQCEICHSNPRCTYCAMSRLCTEDTVLSSACPIYMKKTCCPNDCSDFECNEQLHTCHCPLFYLGFDCSEFHWWIVWLSAAVLFIIFSCLLILAICKCWKKSMKHKMDDLRDQLEEQHNSYVERIQNREVPSNLLIDFSEIKIKRSIGCGSFGEVYEGKWRNSVIAVKKIRIRTSGLSQEEKEEFHHEAAIMSKLLHPNIVLLMGVCEKEPNLCLITEFMQKGSVREVLDDHSIELDWKKTIVMALDAAKGMSYLHGITPPVIHRDLKTANLLVDHNWKVKVADFGVAKMIKDIDYKVSVLSNSLVNMTTLEAATKANEFTPLLHRQAEQYNTTCAGSLRWCAPESMKPKLAATVYGQKVDIFSFGVILWELATREWPYAELKFDFEVMEHVLKGDRLPVPACCPSHFNTLMQECWSQDPRYRPWFPDIVIILDDMCKFFK